MKKILGSLVAFLLLAACAEMPAWWTPRQPAEGNKPVATTPQNPPRTLHTNPTPTMEDLELSLTDESYEEMTLTPLQDEEDENDSGETSAQSVPPEDEDVLPPPSILEE
ncbi:MAG: hypothetical protein J6V32_02720 [Elusimicrobiaceae bacterium]|nr:hypothetical protein [Elusimicrobiaceae bacterium]